MSRLTLERGPFETCPRCQRASFGILSAGGDCVTLRCTECRYSQSEVLPGVEKRVLYLDQSLFSLLFKIESGGRLAPGHEESTREIYRRLRRVVLLQQAVLPHSDVHLDETIVFHSSDDLLAAYERIGGDVRLMNTREVECMQVAEYATAFIEQRDPALSFDVNKVLEDERNVWLPDMHIHAGANFAMLAECVRERRSRSHEAMQRLIERWAAESCDSEVLLVARLIFRGSCSGKRVSPSKILSEI